MPRHRSAEGCRFGATAIDHDKWHCIAMSYDGTQGHVWLDRRCDATPQNALVNP